MAFTLIKIDCNGAVGFFAVPKVPEDNQVIEILECTLKVTVSGYPEELEGKAIKVSPNGKARLRGEEYNAFHGTIVHK